MRRLLPAAAAVLGWTASAVAADWHIPTAVKTLPNGLTVVVSEDHAAPVFGLAIAYRVGFRLEPRGRSGFAHLFEHMMFEGTPQAAKGVYDRVVQGGGGVDNGSTRFDYTDYIATAPVSALEPILWLEADRMRALDFSADNLANQRSVVREEIRNNVTNQPYGLFFWTDLAGLAFDRWENAHDGYGSAADLDAASIEDVRAFHRTYYAPNNAVLAIAGDVNAERVFALVAKHFGDIPAQPMPARPDVAERPNTAPRSLVQPDAFAELPAVAVGWKVPGPLSPHWAAAAVLGEILAAGEASRLHQGLVRDKQLLVEVQGGLGWPLGTMVTINGPALLVVFGIVKPPAAAAAAADAIQAEADRIARHGVTAAELERTKAKMLADLYTDLEPLIQRADLLAIRQAFTGDAASLNRVPGEIRAVTATEIRRAAASLLTAANRATIERHPAGEGGNP